MKILLNRCLDFIKDPTGLRREKLRYSTVINGLKQRHAVVMQNFDKVIAAWSEGNIVEATTEEINLQKAQQDYNEFYNNSVKPIIKK
jgi:hypothetical protein